MFKRTVLLASALAPALLLGACGGTLNRGLEYEYCARLSSTITGSRWMTLPLTARISPRMLLATE